MDFGMGCTSRSYVVNSNIVESRSWWRFVHVRAEAWIPMFEQLCHTRESRGFYMVWQNRLCPRQESNDLHLWLSSESTVTDYIVYIISSFLKTPKKTSVHWSKYPWPWTRSSANPINHSGKSEIQHINLISLFLKMSGQPRRHLLQSGWSDFVSSKRLVAAQVSFFNYLYFPIYSYLFIYLTSHCQMICAFKRWEKQTPCRGKTCYETVE